MSPRQITVLGECVADALTQAPVAGVVDQVTAALLEPAFLDQFADAVKACEEQRTAAARAELTARLAPVRAELAASAARSKKGTDPCRAPARRTRRRHPPA